MATDKQKMVVPKIVENRGNVSKAMREVGYSGKTAKNPENLTKSKGFQEVMGNVVKAMEKERARALSLLPKKADKAKYRDCVDAVDKLTKNIQLLTGKATEKHEHDFAGKTDDELKSIIASASRTGQEGTGEEEVA